MNMNDLLNTLQEKSLQWVNKPMGAQPESLATLQRRFLNLPPAYLALLEFSNGPEGPLATDPLWFVIWEAEKVYEYNEGYEIAIGLPGFLGFGSNGGGELLAFKTSTGSNWSVFTIPFIPMQEAEAILIANDFEGFIQVMGEENQNEA